MASVTKRSWTYNGVEKEAWQVRYIDENGRRRGKQFKLKKEADAFERKVEREIEDGVHTPQAEAAKIADIAAEFIEHTEQRLHDGRIGHDRANNLCSVIRREVIPRLGHKRFRDLTAVDVERWYADQTRRIQPKTAKDRVYMLKLMETFARKRGYMKTSPVSDALPELRGIKAAPIRVPNGEEMTHLLRYLVVKRPYHHDRSHDFLKCLVYLAALCGLRQGEILGLTIANVDFDEGMIRVRHNLTRRDVLKSPKTAAGVRDVPLPPIVAEELRSWLQRHWVANERGLIFRSSTGRRIHTAAAHRPWKAFLARAGLTSEGKASLHFHALRHFNASWLVANGMPITDVANLLGHGHFDVTLQVYAHSVMGHDERARRVTSIVNKLPGLEPSATSRPQQVAGHLIIDARPCNQAAI